MNGESAQERLREAYGMLARILQGEESARALGEKERARLNEIYQASAETLRKMTEKSFEIAVVGLENSGKSTLANALIGYRALPSASVRCTYTTTEIRQDESDHGRIEFYTQAAFEEKLRAMLSETRYPGAERARLKEITLTAFQSHWEKMASADPLLYRAHETTTAEDIRAILRGAGVISQYLDRPPMLFLGREQVSGAEFRQFITGQADENDPGRRDDRPYAVRKATIYSSRLSGLRGAVILDVPGFNSPTMAHREQTKRMMDRADAIILVCDLLSNPNLDGTQLSLLRECDGDRVRLSDKLFVFGNKTDLLSDEKTLRDNVRALREDVRRRELAPESRVITGSARAFFTREGESGIEQMRLRLCEYYESEREKVVEKRAEKLMREAGEILSPFARGDGREEEETLRKREYALIVRGKDEMNLFRRDAREIVSRMYRDIVVRRPFTELLRARVRETIKPISGEDTLYQEILGSLNVQGDGAGRNEMVNASVRMNLQGYFNSLVEKMVWDLARREEEELMDEMTRALLSRLGFDEKCGESAIVQGARDMISDMFEAGERGGAQGFIALITRFVPGLTAAVIGYPLGSPGRAEEVARYSEELSKLFDERPEGEEKRDADGMCCIAAILTHQDYFACLRERNENALQRFFKNRRALKRIVSERGIARFTERWSALCAQYDIDLTGRLSGEVAARTRALTPLFEKSAPKDESEALALLDDIFTEKLAALLRADGAPAPGLSARARARGETLKTMAARAPAARSEKENLTEINADIELYAKLLSDLLAPHLNLEKAFYERFINKINAMTGYSAVYDQRADELMNAWLTENVTLVKREAFSKLALQREALSGRRRAREMCLALMEMGGEGA